MVQIIFLKSLKRNNLFIGETIMNKAQKLLNLVVEDIDRDTPLIKEPGMKYINHTPVGINKFGADHDAYHGHSAYGHGDQRVKIVPEYDKRSKTWGASVMIKSSGKYIGGSEDEATREDAIKAAQKVRDEYAKTHPDDRVKKYDLGPK
jgi:hypothetical protein